MRKLIWTKEEYIQRNSKIYEGIEVSDIKISHIAVKEKKADTVTLSYETSCNTIAGTIQFDNMAELKKTKQGYKLVWQDSLIFPDLESDDKISVTTSKAERGEILDRDGKMLAGKGVATSVGIIPGKLEDRNVSIEKIAELLEIDVETINNKLTAKWVKEDSFVPIETIPKVEEIDLMIIQTKVLLNHFKGLNFDIEQNVITNPSGNAKSKVIKNSSMLIMNPELKDSIGLVAIIILSFFLHIF